MTAWILSLMILLQPQAAWRETYPATAQVVADVAQKTPVFKGEDGPQRTAVLLVSLAFFESRFNPEAYNPSDPGGGSYGLYQASRVPVPDVREQTDNAARMIRQSFRACATLPLDKWLSWYTSGGPKCFPTVKSTHRMALAMKLFKEHPYTDAVR